MESAELFRLPELPFRQGTVAALAHRRTSARRRFGPRREFAAARPEIVGRNRRPEGFGIDAGHPLGRGRSGRASCAPCSAAGRNSLPPTSRSCAAFRFVPPSEEVPWRTAALVRPLSAEPKPFPDPGGRFAVLLHGTDRVMVLVGQAAIAFGHGGSGQSPFCLSAPPDRLSTFRRDWTPA